MTRSTYRLVVGGMAVIALLAVVRSFAGGNEVASQRLGWGLLSFTYPGMWDLLGIIGSFLWVRTTPDSPARAHVRRWGVGITLVAVTVVAFSLGSEAYVTARDTLPNGWPEAAFAASAAVSVIYAVLTHVASKCRTALEEPAWTDSDDSAASSPADPPTAQLPADAGTAPSVSALPSASSTPESEPVADTTSPAPAGPTAGAATSPSSSETEESSAPRPARTSTVAAPSPPPWSGRETLPASFFGGPTTPATPPSSPETSTPSPTSSSSSTASPTSAGDDVATEPTEVIPDETDPNGDPDSPATYGRDGKAPAEVRRQWIRDKRSLNIDVQGADVDRRFGSPRTGARLLRNVQAEQPEPVR